MTTEEIAAFFTDLSQKYPGKEVWFTSAPTGPRFSLMSPGSRVGMLDPEDTDGACANFIYDRTGFKEDVEEGVIDPRHFKEVIVVYP